MRRVLAVVLLTAACSGAGSKADNAALCAGVTADLKGAGLTGTPTREQARTAATKLDARITAVASPALHDAVIRLHQHVHDIETAWRKNRPDDARRAADRARKDAGEIARTAQILLPVGVTHQRHGSSAEAFVLLRETSPQHRLHAQQGKEITRDRGGHGASGLGRARHRFQPHAVARAEHQLGVLDDVHVGEAVPEAPASIPPTSRRGWPGAGP